MITVGEDAIDVAFFGARRAFIVAPTRVKANAQVTGLAWITGLAASAAVLEVAGGIGAGAATVDLPTGASAATVAGVACGAVGAGLLARPAVVSMIAGIHAMAAAVFRTGRAFCPALAVEAAQGPAGGPTGTAVGRIAHDVDAALAAGFGAFGAFAHAGAASAEHVVGATVATGTAVVRIGLQIHTGSVAVGQTRVTTSSASGAVADL